MRSTTLGAIALLAALQAGCKPPEPTAVASVEVPIVSEPTLNEPSAFVPGSVNGAALAAARGPGPIRASSLPLAPFYEQLRRLERGEIDRVRILQLGDSHTAGDVFSGRLRTLFQGRFGDGGRGMQVPGLAYDGIRKTEMSVSQKGKWSFENSLREPNAGPYGLTGFVAITAKAGSSILMSPVDGNGFERIRIDYLQGAGDGRMLVKVDGRVLREVNMAGPDALGLVELTVPDKSQTLELVSVDNRPISLLSITTERRTSGVVVDSHGVSGATFNLIGRWDQTIMKRELEARAPSLVLLAYGTNEGFGGEFDPVKYAQGLAAQIAFIKATLPRAAILLVGPPDGQRPQRGCPTAKSRPANCPWETPAILGQVRAVQAEAARSIGIAFWDWSRLMNGPGGIDEWVRRNPPMARNDHVHFTYGGYQSSGETLFTDIMREYEAWKEAVTPRRPEARRS